MVDLVFRLPDVGEGTTEAEIVAWHVKPGDFVAEDQRLVDVMTDKAIVEMTSPVSGLVTAIHGRVNEKAAVGAPLVVFTLQDTQSAEIAAEAAVTNAESMVAEAVVAPPKQQVQQQAARSQSTLASASPQSSLQTAMQPPRQSQARPLASPAVRRRAFEHGIALQFVRGTGPAGRITQENLDAYIAAEVGAPPSRPPARAGEASIEESKSRAELRKGAVEEVKIVGLRRKIAERMQEAKWRIPHITYVEEMDLTELEALRQHLNETKRDDQPKLTLLPFFVRALVRALRHHPSINARFDDDAGVLHRFEAVHCGIATQTPNGLLVPVVRNAAALDLWRCASEIARLAAAARAGKATREELSGSTITITSLGALGGVSATHVINHPEVAIVGPNKLMDRPVVRDGVVAVRRIMNLSSSFDHRIVDGHEAAEFVQRLKGLLERPATLFIDTP